MPPKSKTRTMYVCQQCGSEQPKWTGRCPDCGEWNTFVETVSSTASSAARSRAAQRGPGQQQAHPHHPGPQRRLPAPGRAGRGVQPRAGRRHGARLAGADQRRPRHRQKHIAASGQRPNWPCAGATVLYVSAEESPPSRSSCAPTRLGLEPRASPAVARPTSTRSSTRSTRCSRAW